MVKISIYYFFLIEIRRCAGALFDLKIYDIYIKIKGFTHTFQKIKYFS